VWSSAFSQLVLAVPLSASCVVGRAGRQQAESGRRLRVAWDHRRELLAKRRQGFVSR